MKYGKEDFLNDLENPDTPHIKDYNRYVAFYEELGKMDVQKYQQIDWNRIKFIVPVGNMLELGCHTGFNLIHFAEHGFTITGVDISSTLLTSARERLMSMREEITNRITLIHSDILHLNGLGKYDTILLTEVLEHVIDPVAILKKTKEFMEPTSKLYVFAPSTRTGNYSHVRGISADWICRVGKEIGINFKVLQKHRNMKAVGTLI